MPPRQDRDGLVAVPILRMLLGPTFSSYLGGAARAENFLPLVIMIFYLAWGFKFKFQSFKLY